MAATIFQLVFFIGFPAFVIWAAKHSKVLGWISPVVLCYISGLVMANVPFINVDGELSMTVSELTVPLAIPLLLLSSDFMGWLRGAKKAILSFFLCVIGVTVSTTIAAFVFAEQTEESWKIAGMMIGVYTGGTPNMSAIGLSLQVQEETFILLNAADIIISGVYLIFLMTVAQRLLLKFLPAYKSLGTKQKNEKPAENGYSSMNIPQKLRNHSLSILLAVAFLGAAVGLSYLLSGGITVVIVILTVTTLGVGGSFIKRIRSHKGTYELGEYLLLVFCIAIGSMANFEQLVDASSTILMYTALVMSVAIVVHFLLAAIFRIDADTVLITSVAGIYGPAFVGPIASVLKNKEIVVTGLTTGLIGYAIGNYWGLMLAYVLKNWL